MKLAVGDPVVYRNHGVGHVAGREKQVVLGAKQEVVVVAFEDGLTITLPVELAQAQLRPLVTDTDLRLVGKALRGDVPLSGGNWLSRRRETLDKLAEGTPVALAEIVSEGAQRERLQLAQGKKPPLASGERETFAKARRLLSDEIAMALGIQHAAAEGWIDRHLSRPG